MVFGLPFDQVWVPGYTSFNPSTQAKFSYHRNQLYIIQSLTVIFWVSRLVKVVYINGHKKWTQAATNMKHAVNESWFPIISVHIKISKLRSGPKWPLFSNPLTYCASVLVYVGLRMCGEGSEKIILCCEKTLFLMSTRPTPPWLLCYTLVISGCNIKQTITILIRMNIMKTNWNSGSVMHASYSCVPPTHACYTHCWHAQVHWTPSYSIEMCTRTLVCGGLFGHHCTRLL